MNLQKIRALAVENNLTARKLGTLLDISETCIYNKLNGRTDFKANEIVKLAELFKVPVEELF